MKSCLVGYMDETDTGGFRESFPGANDGTYPFFWLASGSAVTDMVRFGGFHGSMLGAKDGNAQMVSGCGSRSWWVPRKYAWSQGRLSLLMQFW